MKGKFNFKTSLTIGIALIVIAILIGIIFEHDVAFIFAGLGIIISGISILSYINKGDK